MTGLGEVAREMVLGHGSAISESNMVTIILLVGACHCLNCKY